MIKEAVKKYNIALSTEEKNTLKKAYDILMEIYISLADVLERDRDFELGIKEYNLIQDITSACKYIKEKYRYE